MQKKPSKIGIYEFGNHYWPKPIDEACGAAYRITIHSSFEVGAQFNTLPSGSGIDLSTATFPLEVKINWHHNTGSSCDSLVNIITIDNVALMP